MNRPDVEGAVLRADDYSIPCGYVRADVEALAEYIVQQEQSHDEAVAALGRLAVILAHTDKAIDETIDRNGLRIYKHSEEARDVAHVVIEIVSAAMRGEK
jgi:hypothetical protein